jgi:hypothetical protein
MPPSGPLEHALSWETAARLQQRRVEQTTQDRSLSGVAHKSHVRISDALMNYKPPTSTPDTTKKAARCLKYEHSVAHPDFGDCPDYIKHAAATRLQTIFRYVSAYRKYQRVSCTLLKFGESENQIVGRATKVILDERCGIRFLVLYMEIDHSSDFPFPVRIKLSGGSSCSYSHKRKCVRFDVVWYKSLETHRRIVKIMSIMKGAYRLYVDFGSLSKNQQFLLDNLNRYPLLPIVLSLASKTLRDVQTLVRPVNSDTMHDCVKESLEKAGDNRNNRKYLMLPEKSKLNKSVSSLSNGSAICNSDWERLSRFNESSHYLRFCNVLLFLTP